ncbi:unnamed protein product [Diamesa tonsa]
MEDNQMKLNGEQDMKTQIMSLMFEGMFQKDKDSNYYTPMSKMESETEKTSQMLPIHHFSDYFLRFLPKTIQSPDINRKYWPEHLECKVKSLVEDKALNEESYANLLHILNGKNEPNVITSLQIVPFSGDKVPQPPQKRQPKLTVSLDLNDNETINSTILTKLECDVAPPEEILAKLPTESEYLIACLLESERKYIEDMEIMMTNYVEVVEAAPDWMPNNLIGHKIRLFGNIEEILKFHKMVFYPELLTNFNSALEITKMIINHIQRGSFDFYITYGTIDKQTRCWQQHFVGFMNEVQAKCGKKFKHEPTEHLAKYQKFLQLIQKEVEQQASIKVFQEAENKIHLLLVRISNAFGIYDELQATCLEVPIHLQIEVMNMMNQEFGLTLNKPTLFIVPRSDELLGYQAPLGKLVECSIEQVHGTQVNYSAKYFVFEKCLIYTKYDKQKLLFGKYYNIKDLNVIEAHDAPPRIRNKYPHTPRFVFLDGVYSITLVKIIEKMQKSNATGSHSDIPLNHPAVKQMVDKIHNFS